MRDLAYLQLLAREYPSVKEATSEIVNLMAKDQGNIRTFDPGGGAVTVSKSDLLSRASSSKDDESWTVYRRLAEDHHLQTG